MRVFQPRRRGFTLVELRVVIGIILVLAGLALLVANSGLIGNIRTSSGSDRISGWLMQARAKAQRDGAPRGIRFIVDPVTGFCREAQMIEVPDPYTMPAGNFLMIEQYGTGTAAPSGPYSSRLFVVGPNATDVPLNVAVGDTLSIPSLGSIHRITDIRPAFLLAVGGNNFNAVEIRVFGQTLGPGLSKIPDLGAASKALPDATPFPANPNPPMSYSTSTFGFIRQARPTFGEPPMLLPDSVAIDVANSQLPNVNGNFDVVFSPNGDVQNTGGSGRVILWTRNPEAFAGNPATANGGGDRPSYEQAGEMRLIVVYSKTGAVAVQPVPLPAGAGPAAFDPYSTTKDGIASGL